MIWLCRVLSMVGGFAVLEKVLRLTTGASRLTDGENNAAVAVFNETAIPYEKVRIAEGGVLWVWYSFIERKGRAFTLRRTIGMPTAGGHTRNDRLDILIHELAHVLQFETVGTRYACEALDAQRQLGSRAYDYRNIDGLKTKRDAGERLKDLNREQQAQVAQDYHRWVLEPEQPLGDLEKQRREDIYGPFIEELSQREV
jgi:hypothetical protein